MIRPRLRPTISRRIKYVGIAPTAQKKLGKEARRGSHDLRRLVGHANFMDVLVDNLADEEEDNASSSVAEKTIPEENEDVQSSHTEEFEELDYLDSDSDSDEVKWSDEEDDEDHALSRTASGRPVGNGASTNKATESKNDEDYFSHVSTMSNDNVPDESDLDQTALAELAASKMAELLNDDDDEAETLDTVREVSAGERPKVKRNQS